MTDHTTILELPEGMRSRHASNISDSAAAGIIDTNTNANAATAAIGTATVPATRFADLENNDDENAGNHPAENARLVAVSSDENSNNIPSTPSKPLPVHDADFSYRLFNICEYPVGDSFTKITRDLSTQFGSGALNQFFLFVGSTIITMQIGKNFDAHTLASVSVGITISNVLAFSVAIGFASALDTLCSQAFGRLDGDFSTSTEIGEITQVGIAVCILLNIPFALLLMNSAPIIRAVFGQQYEQQAYDYLFPGAVLFILCASVSACLSKSLQALHCAEIPTRATFVSAIVTAIVSFWLVPTYGAGGASLTMALSALTQSIVIAFFIWREPTSSAASLLKNVRWFPCPEFKKSFTMERVKAFVSIGVKNYVSVAAEWLVFECQIIIASSTGGPEQIAAMSVFFQLLTVAFSLTMGLSVAASSNVGARLGANKPVAAFVAARTVLVWAVLLGTFSGTIVWLLHEHIFGLYTNDKKVIHHLKSVIPVFFGMAICDSVQFSIQAVFRGANRQGLAPAVVLASLWVVGLPCAWVGAKCCDLSGQMTGFLIGMLCEVPALLYRMRDWDWPALAVEAAQKKMEEEQQAASAPPSRSRTDVEADADDQELANINNNNKSQQPTSTSTAHSTTSTSCVAVE